MSLSFKEIAEIGLEAFTGAYVLSISFSYYLNKKIINKFKDIDSFEKLEKVIEEERGNLKISENTKIDLVNKSFFEPSQISRVNENYYKMFINPKEANRLVIRHELFHLKKGHLEKEFPNIPIIGDLFSYFYYHLYAEPQTALYCWKTRNKEKY